MRTFEIFVAPQPTLSQSRSELRDPDVTPMATEVRRKKQAREVLDVFIEGANVTARVAETHASCVLRDLAAALADLARKPRGKAIVRFYDDAWELCIERLGPKASLSVYRSGSDPSVT